MATLRGNEVLSKEMQLLAKHLMVSLPEWPAGLDLQQLLAGNESRGPDSLFEAVLQGLKKHESRKYEDFVQVCRWMPQRGTDAQLLRWRLADRLERGDEFTADVVQALTAYAHSSVLRAVADAARMRTAANRGQRAATATTSLPAPALKEVGQRSTAPTGAGFAKDAQATTKGTPYLSRIADQKRRADDVVAAMASVLGSRAAATSTARTDQARKAAITALTNKGFSQRDIQAMSSHKGSPAALQAALARYDELTGKGFTTSDIAAMASHEGGAPALQAVAMKFAALTGRGFTISDIVSMASHNGVPAALQTALNC